MIPPETVRMHLLSKEFEKAFAVVEGELHTERSLAGEMSSNSIKEVREEFHKLMKREPEIQEVFMEHQHGSLWLPVLYGQGGWNRYVVTVTGEVMFHEGAGETLGQQSLAESVGFRVFPRDLFKEEE